MGFSFCDNVEKHFIYLRDDYHFKVINSFNSPRAPMTEGYVRYMSSTTLVSVSGEMPSSINVEVGRKKDQSNSEYSFLVDVQTVCEYLSLSKLERQVVLSREPKDNYQASTLLYHSYSLYEQKKFNNDTIDTKLLNYSIWLHKYADPFLRGDFTLWKLIYEYKVEKSRARYLRAGRNEYVLQDVGADENGNPKFIERSIFQESLNYLEQLRNE